MWPHQDQAMQQFPVGTFIWNTRGKGKINSMSWHHIAGVCWRFTTFVTPPASGVKSSTQCLCQAQIIFRANSFLSSPNHHEFSSIILQACIREETLFVIDHITGLYEWYVLLHLWANIWVPTYWWTHNRVSQKTQPCFCRFAKFYTVSTYADLLILFS